VEIAWKLYAVRKRSEDRPTVVECLILKRKIFFSDLTLIVLMWRIG